MNQTTNAAYETFKAMCISIKSVKDRCRDKNVTWPQIAGKNFCPTYHIKGMCNSRCGNAADHRTHTAEEDAPLLVWCGENYKTE
jgi:hypothetical protein